MSEKEVIDFVNKVFEENFEIEKKNLLPEAHIFSDLGLDSLDIVDLVVALQKNFGIKRIDEKEMRSIGTLEDVYRFVSGEISKTKDQQ